MSRVYKHGTDRGKNHETDDTRVTCLPSDGGNRDHIWKALGECAYQFSVTEYALLAKVGIVHENDRLELIEGRIEDVSPIRSSHASFVNRLLTIFVCRFHPRAIISVQNPVQLDAYSEPQPDVILLQPRNDFYTERHPTPGDVLLLMEVADTSVEYDQQVKIPLYAKSGIQEV